MRKLFKGGNYSRAETIRGNTIFENFENPLVPIDHWVYKKILNAKKFTPNILFKPKNPPGFIIFEQICMICYDIFLEAIRRTALCIIQPHAY